MTHHIITVFESNSENLANLYPKSVQNKNSNVSINENRGGGKVIETRVL
jgi:hypothetical protein